MTTTTGNIKTTKVQISTLVELGVISRTSADELLQFCTARNLDPFDYLREQVDTAGNPVVSDDQLWHAYAYENSWEFFNPEGAQIPEAIIGILTPEFARDNDVLPYEIDAATGAIKIATPNPGSIKLERVLSAVLQDRAFALIFSPSRALMKQISIYYSAAEQSSRLVEEQKSTALAEGQAIRGTEVTTADGGGGRISRAVDLMIQSAVNQRASDIHLNPEEEHCIVRYRIDGVLTDETSYAKEVYREIVSRIKFLADMDSSNRYSPDDGQIRTQINARTVDIRVVSTPTTRGESIVMRILPTGMSQKNLRELNFTPQIESDFLMAASQPHGIVLVTGPTGSGKSTTLYSAITQVTTRERNVITIEDPVEVDLPGINQTQINKKAGMTYANFLTSALRRDPDIILVGEMRDLETARLGFEAAQTGHMVFSTLHTNDAPSAVTRLVEMGLERFQVNAGLRGVLAQRLARRLCLRCRVETEISDEVVEYMQRWSPDVVIDRTQPIYEALDGGCEYCRHKGYLGRIGIHEFMLATPEIREVITNKGQGDDITKVARTQGMRSLREDGWDKIVQGFTTMIEINKITTNI